MNNILQTINTINSFHPTIPPTIPQPDPLILDPYLYKKENKITDHITCIKLFHRPSATIRKFNEVFPLPTNFYKRNKDGIRIWTKTGFIRFKPKKSVQPERDKQITDHLAEMNIIEEISKPKRFCGQMFVIQKGADSWRPIFNYATLTPFIYSPTFILPNVFQVAKRLKWTHNLWYTKIDIAQAFFNLNIHQDSKFVTAFESNGKFYQFNCLPFGISNAPYNCQLMVNQVTKYIKKTCPLVWAHLDDILIAHQDPVTLHTTTSKTIEMLTQAGWLPNKEKTMPIPQRSVKFLGAIWGPKESDEKQKTRRNSSKPSKPSRI